MAAKTKVPTWRQAIVLKRANFADNKFYVSGYRDGYEGNPQTPPPFKPVAYPWILNEHEQYTAGFAHGEDDSNELYWPVAEALEQEATR